MIDRKKSSEVEPSEAVERSKRSVLKDITPSTRKLPRIADEDMMQTPDDYTDQYVHSDRGISMRSSGVLEEEQSSNDKAPGQDMEEHASESPIKGKDYFYTINIDILLYSQLICDEKITMVIK